jgi:VWFA-related protein
MLGIAFLPWMLRVHAQSASSRPAQTNPAQEKDSNQDPGQNPAQNSGQKDDLQTFKVEVNVVNILFNVKDKHGALVPNLKRDDFELFEDGQKQNIKYFTAENDLPLTLGILIDTSGSQQRVLPIEQEVGAAFLKSVIRKKDLAFVINFDVRVELIQDLTSSTRDLKQALDSVKINTGGVVSNTPGLGGGPFPTALTKGTLLYDAVYLAGNDELSHEVGRKAMIILTDGEDVGSQVKIIQAIEAAQKADAICYVLLIADRGFYGASGYSGDREMRKLAEETGGRVIDVGNREDKLQEAFKQIGDELRSQYSIGYTPTNSKRDGTFRKIEIKATAGKVQARKGYYAPTK